MIKFLPLDFLGVIHSIPRKNKSAVYRLQISALVPEIFQLKKSVKYENEFTDESYTKPNIIFCIFSLTPIHIELSWPICSTDHWNLVG